MNKLTQLDALRGLTSLYVLFAHTFNVRSYIFGINFSSVWRFGDAAIFIFFVISGIVIQLSYDRSPDKSFKLYFFKRFFRIYIPIIIVFITNFFFQLLQDGHLTGFSIPQLITNLLMLQYITDVDSIFFPLFNNGPLWTLSFEWWYYMIFFFFINRYRKYSTIIMYVIFIIACIAHIFYPFILTKFFIFMIIWWVGVEIARLYNSKQKISFDSLKSVLSIVLLGIAILFIGNSSTYMTLISGLFIVSVGLIWHFFGWKFFKQTIGLFLPFASISYSLYISHWFLVSNATYLSFIKIQFLPYIIYIIVCLVYCHLLEKISYPKLNKYFMSKLFPPKQLSK